MSPTVLLPRASGTPLQQWLEDNGPNDRMLWKQVFWDQAIFVRDTLNHLFRTNYRDTAAHPVRVVGTHTSKSLELPVYSITVDDTVTVLLRDNFVNWVVSVQSTSPVPDDFADLFDRDEVLDPVYCEGFRPEWVFGPYASDPTQFTLQLNNKYALFTFCFLLAAGLGLRSGSAD